MYKVKKKETFIPSSNGKDKLHVIVWEPQGEVRAILQISHGMIELIDRYGEFARYLAAKGFVVAGNDHPGPRAMSPCLESISSAAAGS